MENIQHNKIGSFKIIDTNYEVPMSEEEFNTFGGIVGKAIEVNVPEEKDRYWVIRWLLSNALITINKARQMKRELDEAYDISEGRS